MVIMTDEGWIEMGANYPLERAWENPNNVQDGGPRKYIARDTIRIMGTNWQKKLEAQSR